MFLLKRILVFTLCVAVLCAVFPGAHGKGVSSWTAHVTITDGYLNVRERPGQNTPIVGRLEVGSTVTVTGYVGNWVILEVPFEASVGYVKADYLSIDPDASGQYVNVTGGRVRIRSSVGGKIVDWLKAGKTVTVRSWMLDEEGNRWGFVGNGWVRGDCLMKKL